MNRTIKNPDDPSQTYTIGQRGRKPAWYLKLVGEVPVAKPVEKKDRVVQPRPTPTGKQVKYTNCSLMVNGQFYCASKDSTLVFDEADEVRVLCQH